MSKHGTTADPIEKVLADTVEASTYIGLPAGGGDSGRLKNTVQTTDATLTTISTIPITDDELETVDVIISGDGPTGKNYWAKIVGGVRRDGGGGATLVGVPVPIEDDEGTPGYSAVLAVSGNDLLIQVTGAVAETVDWTALYLKTSQAGGGIDIFTSATFLHPVLVSTSVTYNIAHNRGRHPDLVVAELETTDVSGFVKWNDFSVNGATLLGWDIDRSSTINTAVFKGYRWAGSTINIRFKLFFY
jgi:hypothetical protein